MQRRQRAVQILATLVTAVLAALVVIGLTSSRLGRESAFGPATPLGATSPAPGHDYGAPPASANLLYVHDPDNPSWLIGLDWAGAPQATVKLDPSASGALMAPDGQSFAIGMNAKGGTWQFLDRVGKPIAAPSTLPGALPIWADDNKHVCATAFDQQTLGWSLWTELPGESPKQVRVLAFDSTLGETNVRVVACSFKNDVAIAERIVQAWPTEYWLVRLSDGSLVGHQVRSGTDMAMFTASPDATLIAENSSQSTGQVDATAPSTLVIRASDAGVVATLDPSMGVLAFNGDDTAALVTLSPWVGGKPIHLGVVNLASGNLVWQDDGTSANFFGQFVVQPGGGEFAIAYPSEARYPSPSTIVIVAADGSATKLDRLYAPAW